MKKAGLVKINNLVLILCAFVAAYIFGLNLLTAESDKTVNEGTDLASNIKPTTNESAKLYELSSFGISLEVPKNLTVHEVPNYKEDSNDLASATVYIQNYAAGEQSTKGSFQIYGITQYDIPTTTWGQLSEITKDKQTYSYVREVQFGVLQGFEAQYAGQRNRYVYMLLHNEHILTFAVSDPTPENKQLAEQILATVKTIPVKETPITDACSKYSGFHSYAWGGGSKKCEAQGCRVVKLREVNDPKKYDDEGFEFKCVSR